MKSLLVGRSALLSQAKNIKKHVLDQFNHQLGEVKNQIYKRTNNQPSSAHRIIIIEQYSPTPLECLIFFADTLYFVGLVVSGFRCRTVQRSTELRSSGGRSLPRKILKRMWTENSKLCST